MTLLPLIKGVQPPPHNSATPPTPRVGGNSTPPPSGSVTPGSTWGTSKANPLVFLGA